jgi:hypothetical protein
VQARPDRTGHETEVTACAFQRYRVGLVAVEAA